MLIEDDLQPEQLADYRLLILPQVRSLSPEDAQTILDWVRGGGAIVAIGELALADRLNRAYPPEELPELATLPTGDPQALGEGHVWRPERPLSEIPPVELPGLLEAVGGTLTAALSPRAAAVRERAAQRGRLGALGPPGELGLRLRSAGLAGCAR